MTSSISSKLSSATSASWKIKSLPSFPAVAYTGYFFAPGGRENLQMINAPVQNPLSSTSTVPFTARVRPIKALEGPVCPYEKGSNILRAFLYARKTWPNKQFRTVSAQAMEAVYESNRVDGLPRVLFAVSRETEAPLRGKMHGVIRRRFRRRAKMAFKMAIQYLRKENKEYRCDLDICFVLHQDTLRIPFDRLVLAMRMTLLKVNADLLEKGRRNARASLKYLSGRPKHPPHVLESFAKEPAILRPSQPTAGLPPLSKGGFYDFYVSRVTGREREMILSDDGKLIPVDDENSVSSKRQPEKGSTKATSDRSVQARSKMERQSSSASQKVKKPKKWIYQDEDFGYLFGGEEAVGEIKVKQESDERDTSNIVLDWSPNQKNTEDKDSQQK